MRVPLFSLGVALTSGASLALSLLFTRIFSVTMYYHFAFLIVSLAMLGIAVSGVVVYLLPRVFRDERTPWQAGAFAAAMTPAVVLALRVAVDNPMSVSLGGENVARLVRLYFATAMPFLLSGFAIALAITSARQHVGKVYAADLLGAGLGCALMIPLLSSLGAQVAVLVGGATAAAGGALMALSCRPLTRAAKAALVLAAAACVFGGYEARAASLDSGRYRIAQGAKFLDESTVEFERWNALSRITVSRGERDYKWLHIDADAATRMYSASIAENGYEAPRRYSETRLAGLVYTLRSEGPALIIGPGGGSEVTSALRAGVPRVVGVEVNPLIAQTVMRERYAAYNGHLYDNPRVEIHIDDGRSFVRRSSEAYSSIQATLVDTWAASAAGAFALTENNLYTANAFEDYLAHLKPDGIISMTRWYRGPAHEFLRLVGLGREALSRHGVPSTEHARHVFVASDDRMATMLLKKTPYSSEEVAALRLECARSRLHVRYDPESGTGDPRLREFLHSDPEAYYARTAEDLAPSTDDRPFFFYTLRAADFVTLLGNLSSMNRNNLGLAVLQVVLLISIALTLLLVVTPLAILRRAALREQRAAKVRLLLYFLMLGFGYILIELALTQRFVLFLGHPLYALAVVIASLLTASGIGSALSERVATRFGLTGAIRRVAGAVCGLVALYAVGLSPFFNALLRLPVSARIAVAIVLVSILGVLMGMLLPLGVRVATRLGPDLVPWAFGLNGATSVVGSTLAVVVSMHQGFTATLAAGVVAYLIGAAAMGRVPQPSD